jgi:hypothetical protein
MLERVGDTGTGALVGVQIAGRCNPENGHCAPLPGD